MGIIANTAIRRIAMPVIGTTLGGAAAVYGLTRHDPTREVDLLWMAAIPVGLIAGAAFSPRLGNAALRMTSAGHRELHAAMRTTSASTVDRVAGIAHAMAHRDIDPINYRAAARELVKLTDELPRTTPQHATVVDQLRQRAANLAVDRTGYLELQDYAKTGGLTASADLLVVMERSPQRPASTAAQASPAGAIAW